MANTTGKKFGGRKKNTPNKITKEIRSYFSLLVSNNMERLQEDLDALEPLDRVKMIMELATFVIPKLKNVDATVKKDETITISFIDDDGIEVEPKTHLIEF